MNFHVMTLFPEMIDNAAATSILGRAIDKGLLTIESVDIRDYTENKHKRVDDYTYGGGAGMLMQAQPIYDCYQDIVAKIDAGEGNEAIADADDVAGDGNEAIVDAADVAGEENSGRKRIRTIYMTPQAPVFNQAMAREFALEDDIIILCGHYEGVDERVLEEIVTDYISIGDYVLTGGELPALVCIDAISRMVPGVLGNEVSGETESFDDGLLEYPQYSRPEEWRGKKVPEVLMSGHHANIEKWRHEQSLFRTKERRPELYDKYVESHAEEFVEKKKRNRKNV